MDYLDSIKEMLEIPYNVDITSVAEASFLIGNIVSVLLGLAVCLLLMLFTLVTAFDIAFLVIPAFRDRIIQMRIDGTRDNILRFVSRDAINSLERSYIEDRSALSIYLSTRIKAYVISVIILLIFVGYFDYVENFISTVVKGILTVVGY